MPSIKSQQKIKISILGCGAIGSNIAKSIFHQLDNSYELTGLYDPNTQKLSNLAQKLSKPNLVKTSFEDLLKDCEMMVEATSAENAYDFIHKAIGLKKHVLVMSVGKLLNVKDLFELAKKNKCSILIPSGAIAGLDAIKSANVGKIERITLTTRKPLSGFLNDPTLRKEGIDINHIKGEKTIFEGNVDEAVLKFPRNINVAATIALASQGKDKLVIRIITSPEYKRNSHEIEVIGDFGRIWTQTENVVSVDNPKTSLLAILSAISMLKNFCSPVKIGN